MVRVRHAETPESDNRTTLLAKVGWAVKNRSPTNQMNPIMLKDALNAVGCHPRDIIPVRQPTDMMAIHGYEQFLDLG